MASRATEEEEYNLFSVLIFADRGKSDEQIGIYSAL